MINKQASALPRRLIRKFKCNDPFELAEALDIDVMERADFKRQKGAFKVILNDSFIFINANLVSGSGDTVLTAFSSGHRMIPPIRLCMI